MTHIISTPGRLAVALYGATYHTNAIADLDDRSCCIMTIHRAVPHTQLYGPARGGLYGGMCAMCWYPTCTAMVHSAQDQGGKDSLHLVPSVYLSCAEITTHSINSARKSARKRGERHPTRWILICHHHATEQSC